MSHHRELSNPPELHPAPGFSHVAIASGTTVVHFAGQAALDPDFGVLGGDDLGEQTKAAMRNVEIALRAAGVGWDDVVRRTRSTRCTRPSTRRSRPRSTRSPAVPSIRRSRSWASPAWRFRGS